MKLKLTICFSLFAGVCLAVLGLVVEKVTVSDLLKDPKAFSGKTISTNGFVDEFKQKTSKKGNKYFVFKLKASEKDKNKEGVSVFSQGEAEEGLKDGAKVSIVGVFRDEKKIQDFVVKNEIDATKVKDKENGVKLLKQT